MEENKNNNIEAEDTVEKMDLDELDKISGGSIGNAKKEKRKDLDKDVTDRV